MTADVYMHGVQIINFEKRFAWAPYIKLNMSLITLIVDLVKQLLCGSE